MDRIPICAYTKLEERKFGPDLPNPVYYLYTVNVQPSRNKRPHRQKRRLKRVVLKDL